MANEVAKTNTNAVAQSDDLTAKLSALGAQPELVARAVRAANNLALIENPRLPRIKAATTGLLLDASNPDDEPVQELQGVIIFGAKYKAWYKDKYDKENKMPPNCFSHTGRTPDADSAEPQAKACKGCPKNEFETADVGTGKACRDMRRLFILVNYKPGEEPIMPMQLNVTPTSLKAFDEYLSRLVMYGYQYDEVQTKITARQKSRDDKYCVLSFAKGDNYSGDAATLGNLRALKTLWLPQMERGHVDHEDMEEPAKQPEKAAAPSGEF